tara:strand:- start:441 stop:2078 length:1638 start_codon:yes stop_codon:yes gene_type:complete
MGAIIEVKYFNSFILKKVDANTEASDGDFIPSWNGSTGVPQNIGGYPVISGTNVDSYNWAIEEARIRGGYNNTIVDLGVRAYIVEEEANAINRSNSLIYSGIFNSRTGINDTNVFSIGDEITKSADPANGSIQKLYAEDTNLIIFQESKVSRALIDKDAIYSAEGGSSITNINTTIGTIQPYGGNFGISRDPGSFAAYGYRKYFTDKDRNSVLRLSMDGLTEISNYGMYDFFRDEFQTVDSSGAQGQLKGGWDIHNKQYVLSAQTSVLSSNANYNTLSFDESVKGWTSFFTYKPDQLLSLRSNFYTMKDNGLWKHYSTVDTLNNPVNRGSFYGTTSPTSIQFVFNNNVGLSKVFKTVSYEGSNGWQVNSFSSDSTGVDVLNGTWASFADTSSLVKSYYAGSYTDNGITYRVGFDRKENKYHANLINNSYATAGEVISGISMSGIKGFFANVVISTDGTFARTSQAIVDSSTIFIDGLNGSISVGDSLTGIGVASGTYVVSSNSSQIVVNINQTLSDNVELFIASTEQGGAKELFAVSSNYSESSY